jgi:hypothetical protein
MTMPFFTRKDAEVGRSEAPQTVDKPTEGGAEKRLGDLIRREDRSLSAPDPARELRRRTCPSGE